MPIWSLQHLCLERRISLEISRRLKELKPGHRDRLWRAAMYQTSGGLLRAHRQI